jgi:hypothetical protein
MINFCSKLIHKTGDLRGDTMPLQCPSCNTINKDTANFCNNCGSRLKVMLGEMISNVTNLKPDTIPEGDLEPDYIIGKPKTLPEDPEDQEQSVPGSPSPVGIGWSPSAAISQQSFATDSPAQVRDKQKRHPRKRKTLEGEVRKLKESHEADQYQKWSFWVQSYNEIGNRDQLVPVQMRGKSFEGAISEGDRVRITGEWQAGKTLNVSQLYNMTTDTTVKARGIPAWQWVWTIITLTISFVIFAAICGVIDGVMSNW